ncbi:MAG: hypothetical protein JWN03_8488, partial [Nocardia sp.]|nr:hypothetical protein [Nocardia sp.]
MDAAPSESGASDRARGYDAFFDPVGRS